MKALPKKMKVACGFGTVYEGLEKIGISGNDAVLITGLEPVGLAAAMLCRAMGAQNIIGVEAVAERIKVARKLKLRRVGSIKLFDTVLAAGPDNVAQIRALTGGFGMKHQRNCGRHWSRR